MVAVEAIPIVQIGVIVLSAFIFGIIFSKMGFSSAVGYILAGLLLGPFGVNYLAADQIGVASVFGEIGVMMLLFYLGLELNIRRFKETGAIATILAAVEMLAAFVMGFAISKYFGFSDLESVVIGAMLTATSTVITSKFIIERKMMDGAESKIVISVLILEDFLAILILVFVASLVEQKSLNILVINALFFVIAMFFLVSKVSKHVLNFLSSIGYEDQMWLYAIGVFITVAFFGSTYLGLSAALGAYFAGFALAESAYGERIKRELGLFREFFVLFFFVSFGATAAFPDSGMLYWMVAALVIGYILAKLLSDVVFGTAVGLEMKSAVTGGLLMGSVGEFALIIAASLKPLHLQSEGGILSLAFMLTLVTTITMPVLFSQKDKITAFFERAYPFQFRRKGFLEGQINALDGLAKDAAFQNEYLVSLGALFKNLVIAVSIVYLSYLANFEIKLGFAPFIPSTVSVSIIILALIVWPIYKFINELKYITKRVANGLLIQVFPTKDKNILAIERQVGDIFSGIVLVLTGAIVTVYMYYHFQSEILFLLIPAAYTVIAIMYLSRAFYGLIEQYEQLEENVGIGSETTANLAFADLSKEFNAHAKTLQQLQAERMEAKDRIQEAIRTNNLLLAKQALSQFKKFENRALTNIMNVGTYKRYPQLRSMLEADVNKTAGAAGKIGEIDTKEAFVKYMQEHLKPQLYEIEAHRKLRSQKDGKAKLKGKK
ncbi:MAG TPA: cation:proton antiporter [Candidatus Norongarragalinales archaeon]|nr:cation:proton antiporter [Candidatus Norongarragalinales archaeon]